MSVQQSPKSENKYPSIEAVKNRIIDVILLVSIPLTIIVGFLIWQRDIAFGFEYALEFFLANSISVFVGMLIYFFRKNFKAEVKIFIVSTLYILAGLRAFFELGSVVNPYILIGIGLLVLQLMVNRKWIMILTLLALMLFIIAILKSFSSILLAQIDYNELLRSWEYWAADVSIFALLIFIIIFGVGRYQEEIYKFLSILQFTNQELDTKNKMFELEIKQRQKYESEVILSSQKFELLFQSSNDGVVLIDEGFHIIEANPVVFESTGYEKKELIGKVFLDLVDSQHKAKMINAYYKLMNGELQPLIEIIIKTKNGKKLNIELSSNLIIGGKDELTILSTIRDISFRRNLEDQKFNAVLEAEENERARFSKDLHDDLGPLFSTVKLYVESLISKEKDQDKIKVLNKLSDIVDNGVRQIREVSHNLSPHLLRERGLEKAIKIHLNRIKESSKIETSLNCYKDSVPSELNENIEILIYRIFLELLNNSIKHSGASKISVNMKIYIDTLYFEFCDDGKGFDAKEMTSSKSGIGIKNIMNRIHARNGEVTFTFDKIMKTAIRLPI